MADLLLAIAKALAGVPGLGPVFNPLVSIREEEKSAAENAILFQKLSNSHEISREALDEILAVVVGARQDNSLIREQMVAGFYAVLKLANAQRQLVGRPQLDLLLSGSAQEVEEGISSLLEGNEDLLATEGLVTQEAVRDELIRHFSDDVRTLLAIAQPAGFPKGLVNTNAMPIQSYYSFLETLDGLPIEQRTRVARAVAKKKAGSAVLSKWAALSSFSAGGDKP